MSQSVSQAGGCSNCRPLSPPPPPPPPPTLAQVLPSASSSSCSLLSFFLPLTPKWPSPSSCHSSRHNDYDNYQDHHQPDHHHRWWLPWRSPSQQAGTISTAGFRSQLTTLTVCLNHRVINQVCVDALQEDLPAIEQVAIVKLSVVTHNFYCIGHTIVLAHQQRHLNEGGDGDLRGCCGQRCQVFWDQHRPLQVHLKGSAAHLLLPCTKLFTDKSTSPPSSVVISTLRCSLPPPTQRFPSNPIQPDPTQQNI